MMIVRWTPERAAYIGTRSHRYPGAVDITVGWADEAVDDPHAVVSDPDPRSRSGGVRIVGYSAGAGFVISVVVDRDGGELWGSTAWKTSGGERRAYWNARQGH